MRYFEGQNVAVTKPYLAVGEIVVGAAIVILSVGILPLWAAVVGLGFLALGISSLPWTSQKFGSNEAAQVGGQFAGVLLILGFIAWLAWPAPDGKTTEDVTRTAPPAAPPEQVLPEAEVKPKPATKPAPPTVLATFSARHKHRFQDCEGVLTFTAKTVRYRTDHPEDSFFYSIDQVELDDDGLRDRSGKPWHFEVEGRDVEDVFKRWKAGILRVENSGR